MTIQCNHHFLVNQEKGQKHVFRKSKKYRTLSSVALGTMATALVVWNGQLVSADEVTVNKGQSVTTNSATNLKDPQPSPVTEHTESLGSAGESDGAITVTVPHDTVMAAVEVAEKEGVKTVQDQPLDLGNTKTSVETEKQLNKAEVDANEQVKNITEVTNAYKDKKQVYNAEKNRVETHNNKLTEAYQDASSKANTFNQSVNEIANVIKNKDQTDVSIKTQELQAGDGSQVSNYSSYLDALSEVTKQNRLALDQYKSKKENADKIVASNLAIQKANEAGLAKMKAENEAIAKRNKEGQQAVDDFNRAGQAAVDRANAEKQKLVTDRNNEIEAIKRRNEEKIESAKRENKAIDIHNARELERYKRDLAEISKGEEGFISEALAQALNLNNGEPQARPTAVTRQPNRVLAKGEPSLGGYNRILDSTGFFVYDHFKTGETLSFTYDNLKNASFDGKRIAKVSYDITNLVSPTGTNGVKLVVPNDPTEGFIAYRNDGTGNWRTDKMEFRVVAKYFLADGSQVSFSEEKPGVFTHSSLNHNDVGLEYVKDSSGKFVTINGSTIQLTNEGIARSLGSNRAQDLNLPEEWDTSYSRYAYKGAIVSTVKSGNTYTVTFGQGDMPNHIDFTYWFALNTLPVARTVKPYQPKPHVTPNLDPVPEPINVTPDTFVPKTFDPENPVTFTPKPLEKVTQPNLSLTTVTLPKPPKPQPLPKVPETPTVHFHDYRLTTSPQIAKEVVNKDDVDIHNHIVAKDSLVIYPLTVEDLSPNRPEIFNLLFEDYLPAGYVFDLEQTKVANPDYEVSFEESKNFVSLEAKHSLLSQLNQNRLKRFSLPEPKLYGFVQQDGATYSNSYKLIVNKGTAKAYTITSNIVTVKTPGDGDTTSRIEPQKQNENLDGVVINGNPVPFGMVNSYRLVWDLDQYKGDKSSKETIARGFFFVDDYPEDVLELVSNGTSITTLDDKEVTDLEVLQFESLDVAPEAIREILLHANIAPIAAFQLFIPKDNQMFYDNYVKTGKSLVLKTNMIIKDSLYGKEATYKNKAYQIDFGNGYETDEVINHVVKPDPKKENLNKDSIDINGRPMVIGSQNIYTLTWDLDQYKGIKVDQSFVEKGFYFVDDYPEEAVLPDSKSIQILTTDRKVVDGISIHDFKQLSEAPEKLQHALTKRGVAPKGAFQVFVADNPKDFYESYVVTGNNIIIKTPMTVREEMLNSGKSYENIAYQIDFGQAYETNKVHNFVPVVSPHKKNTDKEGVTIDGKTVLPNTVNYYKITLDYSQYKDIQVTDDVLARGFYMIDDFPEEALEINADGIQIVDSFGNSVDGLSVSVYGDIADAPQVIQEAFNKQGFKPKGAIQIFEAKDPKSFYETYVQTGQQLVVTIPMALKNDLVKSGGQYENTAYQMDFGIAYVTETVVNNVPKLDPKKDVVIDLSQKETSLDGQEVALNQMFNYRLVGSLIPENRATPLVSYGFDDDYDEKHDEYNGVYKAFALVDIHLTDGTVLKAGTELTKFTLQEVDTTNGKVIINFDKSFLDGLSNDSAFQADIYLQMKRIASGDVENTFSHVVNDYVVHSNTVKTHTPEPPTPPTPPSPPTSVPPVPERQLPNTGDSHSFLTLVGGGVMFSLGAVMAKKKREGN